MPNYSLRAIRNFADNYWSGENLDIAVAVAMAESSGDPFVISSAGAVGLWQIMPATAKDVGQSSNVSMLKNPGYNAATAYKVWKKYGWQPWDAYKNDAYKEHLEESKDPPWIDPQIPDLPGTELDGAMKVLGNASEWITDQHNWARVAMVVIGGFLVITALGLFVKPLVPTVNKAAKVFK